MVGFLVGLFPVALLGMTSQGLALKDADVDDASSNTESEASIALQAFSDLVSAFDEATDIGVLFADLQDAAELDHEEEATAGPPSAAQLQDIKKFATVAATAASTKGHEKDIKKLADLAKLSQVLKPSGGKPGGKPGINLEGLKKLADLQKLGQAAKPGSQSGAKPGVNMEVLKALAGLKKMSEATQKIKTSPGAGGRKAFLANNALSAAASRGQGGSKGFLKRNAAGNKAGMETGVMSAEKLKEKVTAQASDIQATELRVLAKQLQENPDASLEMKQIADLMMVPGGAEKFCNIADAMKAMQDGVAAHGGAWVYSDEGYAQLQKMVYNGQALDPKKAQEFSAEGALAVRKFVLEHPKEAAKYTKEHQGLR